MMRWTLILFAVSTLLAASTSWTVHFSPNGGCTEAIVETIDTVSNDTVLVQAYNFTSQAIALSLVHAVKRHNQVAIIVDEKASKQKGCKASFCAQNGVHVFVDSLHAIAHNKVIIAGQRVIGGSFNYSDNAEKRNAENCPISPPGWELRQAYIDNWYAHLAHSHPL